MKCLKCNGDKFFVGKKSFYPKINGIKIFVKSPAFICYACKTSLMNTEQMNILRKKTMEKYNEGHPEKSNPS